MAKLTLTKQLTEILLIVVAVKVTWPIVGELFTHKLNYSPETDWFGTSIKLGLLEVQVILL